MKDNKTMNIVMVILVCIFIVLLAILLLRNKNVKQDTVKPAEPTENVAGWDPSSDEVYITEDPQEYSEYYDAVGLDTDIVQMSKDIIYDYLKDGVWYADVDDKTYALQFNNDGTFVIDGDDTTTSGVYKCEFRSTAPDAMYMILESTYVSMEGYIGYDGEAMYFYSDPADLTQTPPLHEFNIIRR